MLGGSPTESGEARHVYNRGIRMGNLALSIQAGIAMIVSVQIGKYSILLYSVERFTTKYVYLSAEAILSISFLFTVLAASTQWTWACTMTLPWAIVGKCVQNSSQRATSMAIMNLSQCIPEIVAALFGSGIVFLTNSPTLVIVSGISAFIGFVLIILFDVGFHEKEPQHTNHYRYEPLRHFIKIVYFANICLEKSSLKTKQVNGLVVCAMHLNSSVLKHSIIGKGSLRSRCFIKVFLDFS